MTSGKGKRKGRQEQVEKEAVKEKRLTKKEVQGYKFILLKKLSEAEKVLDKVIPRTLASDPGDLAQQEIEVHQNLNEQGIARREIRRILQALARIEAGEFGICQDCDEPIPRVRLNCQPMADCCIACTRLREEKAKKRGNKQGALNFSEI